MQKSMIKKMLSLVIAIVAVFFVCGCQTEVEYTIALDGDGKISMYVKEEADLPAVNTNGTIAIDIDDDSIISYTNNKVKALKEGSTTITISLTEDSTKKVTITVTVNPEVLVEVDCESFYPSDIASIKANLAQGETITNVTAADATIIEVQADNKIKALEAGSTLVTITTSSGRTFSSTIEVLAPIVHTLTFELPTELFIGEKYQIDAVLSDSTDTIKEYTSSDNNIASFIGAGLLEAKSNGEVTITLQSVNGLTETKKVEVKQATTTITMEDTYFSPDETTKFTVSLAQGEVIATVTSSNSACLTVIDNTTLKAISTGTVELTIVLESGKVYICEATVKETPTMEVTAPDAPLEVGEKYQIATTFTGPNDTVKQYTSSNEAAVTVSTTGEVTAVANGEAVITITSTNGLTKEITVVVKIDETKVRTLEITAEYDDDQMYYDSQVRLKVTAGPVGTSNEVEWSITRGASYASIDEEGYITFLYYGETTFVATSVHNKKVKATIVIKPLNYINPDRYLSSIINEAPIFKKIFVTGFENSGASSYWYYLLGGATKLYFDEITVKQNPLASNAPNRPGTIMNRVYYVTVHDTAAASAASNGLANSNWCTSPSNTGSSWQYTIGNDGIYQQLPDNEVAWHAGDGTRTPLQFTNTGIKAKGNEPAKVTISSDGYFELNGIKSDIKAPLAGSRQATTADLPYTGVNNYVNSNGIYMLGNTHWDSTYLTLANYGGNLNSIGIETAINKGSNIYLTWSFLSKLIGSKLLMSHGLKPVDVKQHNTFSGKNCPQTMREAGMWESFMDMVVAEYNLRRYFKDWSIKLEFTSDYIDATGIVQGLPEVATDVPCKVVLSDGTNTYQKEFTLKLPARPDDYLTPLPIVK